jgi:outer membrane murein-binding lipoprotein Lpp
MRIGTQRALAAATLLVAGTSAWAQTPGEQQLQNQVQELQNKVAALEAKQASNSKDLAAAVDGMLRDAEKRSQLLATNGDMSAGYDNGFFIKVGDAWTLRPGAQFQFRNVSNFRDNAKADGSSSFDNGFEIRRMKFSLEGNVLSKDLDYFFIWQTPRDSGVLTLEEAWARYFFADQWGVRAGHFKDFASHEWLVSTRKLMTADLSMVDSVIGGGLGGFTQGVTLIYGGARSNNNPLNIEVGYTDGANQLNTDFQSRTNPPPTVGDVSVPGAHAFEWGITGRAEFKVMGDWKAYKDFTAKGTTEPLLVFGAGGDWSQGGDGNLGLFSADAQYENQNGLAVYTAGYVHYIDPALTGGTTHSTDWGALLQASQLIGGNWEVFGRYDITLLDHAIAFSDTQSENVFHEITVGFNYYMGENGSAGHRAKFTVDLSYLPNGAPAAATGSDILDKNAGQNELMLRVQFQLLI